MCNTDIRSVMKQNNIRVWQLADLLNISEATIIRKLRHELSTEEKERIFKVINSFKDRR